MQSIKGLDKNPNYLPIWQRLKPLLDQGRIPQAVLFVAAKHLKPNNFALAFVKVSLCAEQIGCGGCRSCKLIDAGNHPDVISIRPETPKSPIKIEQIRALQNIAYASTQQGNRRFVIFEQAERMNQAAANALLKMLEEPAQSSHFILLAETVSGLLPTIRSRCQIYTFPSSEQTLYLELGSYYDSNTERGKVVAQQSKLLNGIQAVLSQAQAPCQVAKYFEPFSLDDSLWWLYLLNSELIYRQLTSKPYAKSTHAESLTWLCENLKAYDLFKINHKIIELRKKMALDIPLNAQLVIEAILIQYVKSGLW